MVRNGKDFPGPGIAGFFPPLPGSNLESAKAPEFHHAVLQKGSLHFFDESIKNLVNLFFRDVALFRDTLDNLGFCELFRIHDV